MRQTLSLNHSQITLTTVGYGDKSPRSQETQIAILFVLVYGLVSKITECKFSFTLGDVWVWSPKI